VTIWSFFQSRHRNRAIIGAVLAAVTAAVSAVWQPALASPEDPRVIAVHTGSPPRVSMIVEVAPGPSADPRELNNLSVWMGDTRVPTTITPVVSDSLSVALVIDTASATNMETLQRVQSGATEFLLRLPPEVHSMVVAAGGDPQIVAPLTPNPAAALSGVTGLRSGGTRSTAAAVMLAADKLAAAPPGPRAIVVYAHGTDNTHPPVENLTCAINQAEAVVSVIQTGEDRFWAQVLSHVGGEVIPSRTGDIAQSYGRAATALSHQYLVTFDNPGGLPAQARLVLSSGDASSETTVELPSINMATPMNQGRTPNRALGPISIAAVIVLLSILGLLVLLRRGRGGSQSRRGRVAQLPSSAGTDKAPSARTEPDRPESRRPDDASAETPVRTTPDSAQPRRRSPLSDAVHGARAARQAVASDTERMPRPRLPEGRRLQLQQPHRQQPVLADIRPEMPPGIKEFLRPPGSQRPAVPRHRPPMVIAGSGGAVVQLTNKTPAAIVIHIVGNSASRYFGVQAVETGQSLVNTTDPYDGVRLLDWDGGESVSLQVQATGPWLIDVLTLADVPSFDASYTGDGDAVVRYTGTGSIANIVGNAAGRYFGIRSISTQGILGLVNTTDAYSETSSVTAGPQFFEIQAVGSWTITVT
jgi:von Willebrand factor type A domain